VTAAPALLSGWGRTAATRATLVRPASVDALREALLAVDGRGAVARGLGRAYGDAAQNGGGTVLGLDRLDRLERFDADAGEVVAEAGLSLERLLRTVVPLGFFVAVTPGTRHVTVGGAIAADVHGKNHHRDGSFSRHVRWLELLTPDGRVRRLEPSDPLFGATAGGMGLTGVITRAALRLLPIRTGDMRVTTERGRDLDEVVALLEAGDREARYSVAWVDCLAGGDRLGRGVVMLGDHAEPGDRDAAGPPAFAPASRLGIPVQAPAKLLNTWTARAFNAVWFAKAPRRRREHRESLGAFFHPLDGVRDWNRLYGRTGFVQYQFVVPFDRADVLRSTLERLGRERIGSFLAVLKRFGPGTGLLSFPMPGWTLAMDIPANVPGLPGVLDALDEQVAGAGGRVYLAKDSRASGRLLGRMYPELDRWRALQRECDPGGVMRSDLARRLGLTGEPAA
jgi:decaprenylphospho-beta-D-ribofuranose 2-oxidase